MDGQDLIDEYAFFDKERFLSSSSSSSLSLFLPF
jgi:hypothetical protein